MKMKKLQKNKGLYQPSFERDNCGFGLITQMDNKPSHWVIDTSINALSRLMHRGAVSDDGKSSDGCGLLIKKPDEFLKSIAAEHNIELGTNYAFGVVFFGKDRIKQKRAKETLLFQLKNKV